MRTFKAQISDLEPLDIMPYTALHIRVSKSKIRQISKSSDDIHTTKYAHPCVSEVQSIYVLLS